MAKWLTEDKRRLRTQYNNNTLPHALIFSGVKGVGKNDLSQWLIKGLLCQAVDSTDHLSATFACGQCQSCQLVASHNHPDHLTVQLTGTSVGVDQIRAVSRMFEKTAQLADNQTVIIEDADKMTEAASNALLKTLEEPSNNSFIILLVKDVQRLLPTIISRCYHLPLTPPVGDKLLAELGVNNSDKFVNLSHLTELTDRTVQQAFQLLSATYINYLMTQQNRMAMLELLLHSEHSLRWLERITVDLSRCYHLQSFQQISYLTEQCEQQALQGFINQHSNSLAAIFNVINECSKQLLLLTQINKEFCLEKLLVDIADIINSHVAQPRGI